MAAWHVIRLIQLKPFNRWASVLFFGLWTLTLTWNAGVLAFGAEKPLRPVLVLLAFAMLNILSIWYLVRRAFRDFAVQFVSEREREKHSRMMEKIAKKKAQKGLGG